MRISDVVSLATDRISGNRLFLYTQKTGVPVHSVLPDFVVRVLELTPRCALNYFFWSGSGKLDSAVRSWQTRLRKLFKLANIANGHAHRFRDAFGVELLLAGIPIERVSVLLGHQSVKVTEKHYNPWVRSRQEQLEADLQRAWSRDPLVLLETEMPQRYASSKHLLATTRRTGDKSHEFRRFWCRMILCAELGGRSRTRYISTVFISLSSLR